MTYRGTDGIGPTPAVVTEAVEEAVTIVTGTQTAVVTIGRVVNLGTTAAHYCATHFGTRLVVVWTASGRIGVTLAIVATVAGTNCATVVVAAIVATVTRTNCATIVVVTSVVATVAGTNCAAIVVTSIVATVARTNCAAIVVVTSVVATVARTNCAAIVAAIVSACAWTNVAAIVIA